MSNITKTHKISFFAMFIAAALIGSVVALGDNYAYAGGNKKHNDAEQEIEQGQASDKECLSASSALFFDSQSALSTAASA